MGPLRRPKVQMIKIVNNKSCSSAQGSGVRPRYGHNPFRTPWKYSSQRTRVGPGEPTEFRNSARLDALAMLKLVRGESPAHQITSPPPMGKVTTAAPSLFP